MKKIVSMLLLAGMCVSLVACGGSNDEGKPNVKGGGSGGGNEFAGVTMEVAVNYTGDGLTAFQNICDDFEKQSGCEIVLDNYGGDYSNMMTTRCASNELPDVFMTAGWSLKRFKEYSMDLSGEKYIQDYNETAQGVLEDEDGKYYAMMMSCGVNGNVVNLSVCEAAGVDPLQIHTWDDFLAACKKVKDAGFTAIASTPDAGLTANIAGTFLSYEGEVANVNDAILNGTWDWSEYMHVLKFWQTCLKNGYLFKDAKSMNTSDMYERFASGQAAFIVAENSDAIQTCLDLNSEGKFIFAPYPASKEGGEEVMVIGEGDAFAIWKDSQNVDCAKSFLNYLATKDVTLKLIAETGRTACQKTVMEADDTSGTRAITEMQKSYADHNLAYHNLWDREYLPTGMWGKMGNAATKLFSNYESDAKLQSIIDDVKKYYDICYASDNK